MRRGSLSQMMSQSSGEPVIVVEEALTIPEENEKVTSQSPNQSLELESPTMNPYLLSPWRDPRDIRKHSLPTPQCSGITASQVRRLSDRGGEGPSPREAAFLATLSTAPAPSASGRRHSVVTISKVPTTLFGRNRRESIAAFPAAAPNRVLGSRRESISSIGPPSTENRGSIHNLQLDIMDDIVTARKVRMKMWNTSKERVCEVQPLDEAGPSNTQRYTQNTTVSAHRRFSDFVTSPLTVISSKRRASEFPVNKEETIRELPTIAPGIVCTNTDLISILSNLTSSATEINSECSKERDNAPTLDQKRNRLKSKRSNSFDVSILHGVNTKSENDVSLPQPSSWFVKRHQPMSKKETKKPASVIISMTNEAQIKKDQKDKKNKENKDNKDPVNKVVWDGRSGSVVDAEALGSAIEVFLRRGAGSESQTPSPSGSSSPSKGAIPKTTQSRPGTSKSKTTTSSGWYSKDGEDDPADTCDTSLCSTLKDLFVK